MVRNLDNKLIYQLLAVVFIVVIIEFAVLFYVVTQFEPVEFVFGTYLEAEVDDETTIKLYNQGNYTFSNSVEFTKFLERGKTYGFFYMSDTLNLYKITDSEYNTLWRI